MDENTNEIKNTMENTEGKEEITRSIRANRENFAYLNEIAANLGVKQGGAFEQLLSFWKLNHASDAMQSNAAAVEQVQELLGRLGKLFAGQFEQMRTLDEQARAAASIEIERVRGELDDAKKENERLKEATAAAVAAQHDAEEEAKAGAAAAVEADERARKAEAEAAQAAKEATDALAALGATRDAITEAKTAAADAVEARKTAEAQAAKAVKERDAARAAQSKAEADATAARASLKDAKAEAKEIRKEHAAAIDKLADKLAAVQKDADARVTKAEAAHKAAIDKINADALAWKKKTEAEMQKKLDEALAESKKNDEAGGKSNEQVKNAEDEDFSQTVH